MILRLKVRRPSGRVPVENLFDIVSNPLINPLIYDLGEIVLIHLFMTKTKNKLFLEVELFWCKSEVGCVRMSSSHLLSSISTQSSATDAPPPPTATGVSIKTDEGANMGREHWDYKHSRVGKNSQVFGSGQKTLGHSSYHDTGNSSTGSGDKPCCGLRRRSEQWHPSSLVTCSSNKGLLFFAIRWMSALSCQGRTHLRNWNL